MIYLELFWSFFQIGLFSIGGGYAAMPLIQDQVVDIHPWLTMTGFADIMAIAEMTPGPIALNAATFVGIQVAGLPGALIATIGCIFPSCVIVMTLAYLTWQGRKGSHCSADEANSRIAAKLLYGKWYYAPKKSGHATVLEWELPQADALWNYIYCPEVCSCGTGNLNRYSCHYISTCVPAHKSHAFSSSKCKHYLY